MEFILVIVIIAVLCIILRISTEFIIIGILAFIGLVIVTIMLMFIYFFICLLFSKKHEAYFSRIDRQNKNKFRTAYYIVDGTEYPCVFPAENIFTNTLYKKEHKYHVLLNLHMKRVFDRFAIATCIIGFLTSLVAIIFIIYMTV